MNNLLKAIKFKLSLILNKLTNRIRCEHLHYIDVNCYHTGLFMYQECTNCGKKKYI